ncbi:Acetylornithine deacetylase (plasmid) [Legionella adelaidensis]|uniref:Acetylornithine deacetylase n=1 Tax=Legionella adelaidensis TaxID=45056 RepID=A0A0W0R1M8_9GAMM|nr:acetylornithine deacetylase [Legionella adelaidensis]KTC64996.1 acetylornithine deacetylase [Legionella adelaidensis]VEH85324.1 Acetylornithine deacetylase [Legionella adelaidensis]
MNTTEWLTQLISFDTTSRNSNLPLIEHVASWFEQHEIEYALIPGPSDTKTNLLATIPTNKGSREGGLVLSGHTDVVPVDGQIWQTDPFTAEEREGKIFGRGACDMKGFLAVMLALIPEFKVLRLTKPLHFSFTYDEEVGCLGVQYLLDYLAKSGIQPEGCIVGEPSSMQPIVGYKGRNVFHCQVKGLASHSSLTNKGCNAIEYASQIINYIRSIADYFRLNGPYDQDFDLPYTTITTNVISGGTAFNIVPDNCEFIFEVRHIPEFSLESFRAQIENYIEGEIVPEMRKNYPKATVFLNLSSSAPGFNTTESSPLTQLIHRVTGIQKRSKVSYSTEAGLFQKAQIPTIICGPGNIEQAHGADEFVSKEQLIICERVLRNVVNFYCQN